MSAVPHSRWIAAFGLSLSLGLHAARAEDPPTLRIGWQPTTTVEAQIAHTLQKTDILERNGVKAQFTMFSYGPAVNEALVSGAIDVGFIGDLPSVSLAAVGSPTTVVARESTFRGAIIARPGSGINTLADLKGRKLYGPVGSAIYLSAMGMLAKAGLTPGTDVTVVNMGFTDLSDALKAGRVDAVFVWDPWVENFVQAKLAEVISADTSLTMVTVIRDEFKAKSPDTLKRFLKAQKEALLYASLHPDLANGWFREPAAAKALRPEVVATATAFDPLWGSKNLADLRLAMTPDEMARYVGLGEKAADLKIYPKAPPVTQKTDMAIAAQLDKETWSFDPSTVKVK